jgi:hypothetical protein
MAGDPLAPTRTWQDVINAVLQAKSGPTHSRWEVATRQKPFDHIQTSSTGCSTAAPTSRSAGRVVPPRFISP